MNAIELKGVRRSFGDFTLGPLDLVLPEGCILGLVGENGAGKSTTIMLILNMLRSDSGAITLLGKEPAALQKEDIGIVLDEVGISGCLTPAQVGAVMSRTFRNWDGDAYRRCLKRFSLPEKKKFRDFSRGMKMKLGIAVALSHGARLLILDEATSGLDPVVRDEILDIFMDFTRDPRHSILISSHIVSDLEKICDYIAFLHKGRLMLLEEKDVLREQYGILRCSEEDLSLLEPQAIAGKKVTAYGVEALVRRSALPAGMSVSPVDIEQLFIFMTKEANRG